MSNNKEEDSGYRGMHNGTVKGKWFEGTRRARKPHSVRRAARAQREQNLLK